MSDTWYEVALRIVRGLGAKPGELVQIRDRAGRYDVLQDILLAVEMAGATPLPEIIPPEYMRRMLSGAEIKYLSRWDFHRQRWMSSTDRIIVLEGAEMDESSVPSAKFEAWRSSAHRLTETEERLGPLPFMLAAIPTEERAKALGLTLEDLEKRVIPALLARPGELRETASRVLEAVRGARTMILRSGRRHELNLSIGDRRWISDDGLVTDENVERGGVVSNLPAGSVYTTVIEGDTEGELWLPKAGTARDVILRFKNGRVSEIFAKSGVDELKAMFDAHSGEARRISHIGVGLNPALDNPLGWTLVDENMAGHVFVAFGENRYMGGKNASSLNVDFSIAGATLEMDRKIVVETGALVV